MDDKPKFLNNVKSCPRCNNPDTVALMYENHDEDDIGVIWCSRGHMEVMISQHMEIKIIRGDSLIRDYSD